MRTMLNSEASKSAEYEFIFHPKITTPEKILDTHGAFVKSFFKLVTGYGLEGRHRGTYEIACCRVHQRP